MKTEKKNWIKQNIKKSKTASMGVKKFLRNILGIYLAAYIGLSGFAIYDFKKYNKKRIETKAKNSLVVKNYKVNLESKLKELTIVGETHQYNHAESKYAKELVKNYDVIAYEGGMVSARSKAGERFRKMIAYIYLPSCIFYGMGSGRYLTNPTIGTYAWRSNKKLCYLENGKDDSFDNLSFGQKSVLSSMIVLSLLEAPLAYYAGRGELTHRDKNSIEVDPTTSYAANLHKRDKLMADNIAKLIKKEDIDKLMCVMGQAHVKGVVKHLKSSLEMEERRNLD